MTNGFELKRDDDVQVVHFVWHMTFETIKLFDKDEFKKNMQWTRKLILDLWRATMIDSSCLWFILTLRESIRNKFDDNHCLENFKIINTKDKVYLVLNIANFPLMMKIERDR